MTRRRAVDQNKEAEGKVFLDDESTFKYQDGAFAYKQFKFSENVLTSTTIDGIYWLRAAILSFRTHLEEVDSFLKMLESLPDHLTS